MAKDKRSFVLYCDLIHTVKKLPKETRGALFLHILEYVNDMNPVIENDVLLEIAFEPIKQQLKRDLKDWEGEKMLRSESGRLGGIKSGESRRKKQKEANEANASNALSNEANEAVNVSVSVNDNVNTTDEGVLNQKLLEMLVPEMLDIWLKSFPNYQWEKEIDYPACLQIAYHIAKKEGWKQYDIVEEKKDLLVMKWQNIVRFIESNKYFSSLTINAISNPKMWQSMMNKINNSKPLMNGLETAREEYLKNKLQ